MKQAYHWQNFKPSFKDGLIFKWCLSNCCPSNYRMKKKRKWEQKKKKQDLGTRLLSENVVEAPSCFCCSTQFKKKRQEIVENWNIFRMATVISSQIRSTFFRIARNTTKEIKIIWHNGIVSCLLINKISLNEGCFNYFKVLLKISRRHYISSFVCYPDFYV